MTAEVPVSLCPRHDVPATGVCDRCGRFGCGRCIPAADVEWCTECLARPEARLTPSPTAQRALWMALVGFHGVVVLLPIAAWLARMELIAISAGTSPVAGRPWAQGALGLSLAGAVLWALALLWWSS
jgi:hypothetical protein